MFTGLIEEIGTIAAIRQTDTSFDLTVRAQTVLDGVVLGDSIAVNGVCLTVTRFDAETFTVGLAPETRVRTNLGALKHGAPVNLERSVTPTTRMGGHYVQGHVDGTGEIIDRQADQDALWVTIRLDPALMRYVVTKGYVAIDGTSLTVVDTGPDWFNVTLIAYTQQKIILAQKAIGDSVNLEVDILAKYVERLVAGHVTDAASQKSASPASSITPEFLSAHGYSKKEAS
ncbi:MAG: riboflavin synthase [Pseudomonadota bacterium]